MRVCVRVCSCIVSRLTCHPRFFTLYWNLTQRMIVLLLWELATGCSILPRSVASAFSDAYNLTQLSVQVNRGCVLSCQPPDNVDLLSTARCIYKSVNERAHVMKQHDDLLNAVCQAYSEYYLTQVRSPCVLVPFFPLHGFAVHVALPGDPKLPRTPRLLLSYCLRFCEAVQT